MSGHELWDQFDALNKKTELGIQLLRDILEVFQKHIKINADYGKALVAFSKEIPGAGVFNKNPPVTTETKTLKAALQSLQLSDAAYGQHIIDFTTKLTADVIKGLETFIKTKDAERKKLITDGQKFIKVVNDAKAAATKAQSAYTNASKDAEAAREALEKIPAEDKRYKQAEQKSTAAAEKAKLAETAYQVAVEKATDAQNKWFNDEMPPVLEGLKELEAERFKHLHQAFKSVGGLKNETPEFLTTKVKEMLEQIEAASWNDDWDEWVGAHKPAKERPDAIEFAAFQGKYTAAVEKKEEPKKEEPKKEEPKKEEPKKEEAKTEVQEKEEQKKSEDEIFK